MYLVDMKAARRTSIASSGQYSRKDDDEIENGLVTVRKNETLPVHKTKNGSSWSECIFQIFFTIQGPAFFILPSGFKDVGYIIGILGAFGIALFYMYTTQMYLWCEQELRRKKSIPAEKHLSIYSLVDLIFVDSGRTKGIAYWLNAYLKYEIIVSWSFNLSFNMLFVCKNIIVILRYFGYTMSNRMMLILLFPVTTAISWVPNLKMMSAIAYFSALMVVVVMFEILYYILIDPLEVARIKMVNDVSTLPTFLATVYFTIISTPLVFPLKNEMKQPSQFGSVFGSFNVSIMILIILNVFFSLFCYLKYGEAAHDNIIENLPHDWLMNLSNVTLTVAMLCSGAVSFFVVFESVWNGELETLFADCRYVKLYEYVVRTCINFAIMVAAIAIPSLDVFINLISCFSYPYDSIFLPAILQMALMWKNNDRSVSFAFYMALNALLIVLGIAFSIMCFVGLFYNM